MDLELADRVRRVIDTNSYMALGTTDEVGHPWFPLFGMCPRTTSTSSGSTACPKRRSATVGY
jgi:hypothetical protein